MKKEIMYLGVMHRLVAEVDSIDEAQALLDYERKQGRTAAATHENDKHQIYSYPQNSKEVR